LGDTVEIVATDVSAGATESGSGFVNLSGTVTIFTFDDMCPCEVAAEVNTPEGATFAQALAVLDGDATTNGVRAVTVPVSGVFQTLADETLTYSLNVRINTALGQGTAFAQGNLVATYVPFLDDVTVESPAPTSTGVDGASSADELRSPAGGADRIQAP
ncbi:hypothetical protein B7486_65305, partial [cyanobacterium TDX16]